MCIIKLLREAVKLVTCVLYNIRRCFFFWFVQFLLFSKYFPFPENLILCIIIDLPRYSITNGIKKLFFYFILFAFAKFFENAFFTLFKCHWKTKLFVTGLKTGNNCFLRLIFSCMYIWSVIEEKCVFHKRTAVIKYTSFDRIPESHIKFRPSPND